MKNKSHRYTTTAVSLHWLITLGLTGTLALGFYMNSLPFSPAKLQYISWHKWAGISLLLLALFRLGWRATHPQPSPPAGMPAWQHAAAEWTHRVLYLLMIAIPLSGWLMSSAKGFPTVYFGLVQLPDLIGRDVELGKQLTALHVWLNFALIGLVGLHALAAVKHHLIDRDDVLSRMLPFLARN
ncbi:MAG: cytochrome b [Candidatus Dactylopiibacterium carminicum]|uniref:Cytochrome b n=1 Tax=Candidatus Dactylopiibacterium carminicum TaxID=857335 RepID=A0A272ET01_9RHOO|nr:cytochrome b [Candidatus Dactylopiibacterium carminicum]KAF7600741.1 cytochrome b [Candidatus Dactylopiibacterium carminicum]PAS93207.1 MAG: cytochrome b [Candidatus Dactylopiibacterium carminicum]PAS95851.1 MAG: cytochrome b [Candidatus Dactylopiibacterium carminicum]PAT00748.1 MAG: cytochrome b [Candidatus Dactylopiibacterium carminicum]